MPVRTGLLMLALLVLPVAAAAQSVDPGFTRAQVEARLGITLQYRGEYLIPVGRKLFKD